MLVFNRFKDGKNAAITMSYDDGLASDKRLVDIFNKYGFKGTFHLNNRYDSEDAPISADEAKKLYEEHEISCHGELHVNPLSVSPANLVTEYMNNRKCLEEIAGYPMRGCSYAYGGYNASVIETLKSCGMEYARTTKSTMRFDIPDDFMQWHPTCHHANCLDMADTFLEDINARPVISTLRLFYVWGHAHEFSRNDNWYIIEEFCEKMANNPQVWYATNIEIKEYMDAVKSIKMSVDNKTVYNPTSVDVWASLGDEVIKIPAGEIICLK